MPFSHHEQISYFSYRDRRHFWKYYSLFIASRFCGNFLFYLFYFTIYFLFDYFNNLTKFVIKMTACGRMIKWLFGHQNYDFYDFLKMFKSVIFFSICVQIGVKIPPKNPWRFLLFLRGPHRASVGSEVPKYENKKCSKRVFLKVQIKKSEKCSKVWK